MQTQHDSYVWGIGLGRTGTKSLCRALEILGYKTVHNLPSIENIIQAGANAACEGIVMSEWKILDHLYPNSKFILTVRDRTAWLDSCERAINQYFPKERIPRDSEFYIPMVRNRMARYGGMTFEKHKLLFRLNDHIGDVSNHFFTREHDLLIIDITKGSRQWELICPFLEKDIPEVPFPNIK